jgi:hypothetical protein
MKICSVDGCEKKAKTRSFCQMHYRRWRLYGDVNYRAYAIRTNGDGGDYITAQRTDGSWDWAHIIAAERALGRPLPPKAQVHHVNFDRSDNTPGNLVVCPNDKYHALLHMRTEALDATGHADWLKCVHCLQYDAPENLVICKGGASNTRYHPECNNARAIAYRRSTKGPPRKENSQAKLCEEDVRRIREMYLFGAKQKEIGIIFGIQQTAISKIVRRVGWSHVL